jgi:chemotaxis receptor (MCP) glutamine deamidase CheD
VCAVLREPSTSFEAKLKQLSELFNKEVVIGVGEKNEALKAVDKRLEIELMKLIAEDRLKEEKFKEAAKKAKKTPKNGKVVILPPRTKGRVLKPPRIETL